MLKAIMSTWTLFFGLLLISAGSGLQVVLLGTRAPEAGFTNIAKAGFGRARAKQNHLQAIACSNKQKTKKQSPG